MIVPRRLTVFEQFCWGLIGWRGFPVPDTERVACPKATTMMSGRSVTADWGWMANHVIGSLATHRLPSSGVGSGTPMQNGTNLTRTLFWGGGYGSHEQHRATIPLPVAGRYWTTGYPAPYFDRRCIIAAPNGDVVEIIQFDQDAPKRYPGFPQQGLGYSRWRDGWLIEGRPITASKLAGHMYVWGPGSSEQPHQQGLVVADYAGGDGSLDDGPRCGGWYTLDAASPSFRSMYALGGECAARAVALVTHGCRIIDRNGIGSGNNPPPPSLLTQAGTWTAGTNLHLWRLPLADLKAIG